jgi:dihydroneopterin aldolase
MLEGRDAQPGGGVPLVLEVTGLKVRGRLGVHDWERGRLQPLTVDVRLELPSPVGDRLEEAADYGAVCAWVTAAVSGASYRLAETLALHLAEGLTRRFSAVACRVRLHKPVAAAALGVADLAVEAEVCAPTLGPQAAASPP